MKLPFSLLVCGGLMLTPISFAQASKAGMQQFSIDKPSQVTGNIQKINVLEESGKKGNCWVIKLDNGGVFELSGIKENFMKNKLKVSAEVHVKENKKGKCIPNDILFIDNMKNI